MQITIDIRDSEEDIRKAIALLQRLLAEKEESEAPKIEIISETPEKHEKILAELLDRKEEGRKKDEAFDVGELVPY